MEKDDIEVVRVVQNWRDRLLQRAYKAVDKHFFDKPLDDFTAEETGIEKGLLIALNEIKELMHDKSNPFGHE